LERGIIAGEWWRVLWGSGIGNLVWLAFCWKMFRDIIWLVFHYPAQERDFFHIKHSDFRRLCGESSY
jgi:hypothetical protein